LLCLLQQKEAKTKGKKKKRPNPEISRTLFFPVVSLQSALVILGCQTFEQIKTKTNEAPELG
jgi:hypothetical protein